MDQEKVRVDDNQPQAMDQEEVGDGDNEPEVINTQLTDLPEEMLEKIFNKLTDAADLKAISNTTPQFNRILSTSKTAWSFNEIFPHIFPELEMADILSCRSVCKHWNNPIDNFLQSHPQDRTMVPYPFHPTRLSENEDDYIYSQNHPDHSLQYQSHLISKDFYEKSFEDAATLTSCLEDIKKHPRNPFVLRSIVLYEDGLDSREYWIAAFKLLSKFGKEIWHAGLGPNADNLVRNYKNLRKALSLMPNLRTLCVYGFRDSFVEVLPNETLDSQQERYLRRYIRHHSLPALPHLHSFQELLREEEKVASVINEAMRRYSIHLKTLKLSSIWNKNPSNITYLPELTRMDLIIDDTYRNWLQLCQSFAAPNLAKLSLNVKRNWKMSNLLEPLKTRFKTLEYLTLRLHRRARDFDDNVIPDFVLENIKTLEIWDSPDVQYDHVLSYLPELEYILVLHDRNPCWGSRSVEEDRELEIRKLMLSGRMYDSDIWTKLESLKEFTFAYMEELGDIENEIASKKQYTREVYNQKIADEAEEGIFNLKL